MLRADAELLAWSKPRRQLILAAPADEEDDVLWIGAQLIQEAKHFAARSPLPLVHQFGHHGAVVVAQQDQPTRRAAVRRADALGRTATER